jgi:hypothetical protein
MNADPNPQNWFIGVHFTFFVLLSSFLWWKAMVSYKLIGTVFKQTLKAAKDTVRTYGYSKKAYWEFSQLSW